MAEASPKKIVGRLAPSPTGALHLGNARTFMIAWLNVRSQGGKLVLRMEDLDHPKNKAGADRQALEDLRWLGFDWDEGPDIGGANGPYVQTRRIEIYRQAVTKLSECGLAYPCICTRRDIDAGQSAPHEGEMLHYKGTCRNRFKTYSEALLAANGRLPAWRFNTGTSAPIQINDLFAGKYEQDVAKYCGDFVLARDADGAGYMLASVLDDAAMGITEIVRGDDLLPATPAQILIANALKLPIPSYIHVPLVVGSDGKRLAKRHGDTKISTYREAGVKPEQIIGALAASCGWADEDEQISLNALLPRYNLHTIPHRPFVWDRELN